MPQVHTSDNLTGVIDMSPRAECTADTLTSTAIPTWLGQAELCPMNMRSATTQLPVHTNHDVSE